MNCIYRSFKADPRNENRRNINVSPVVVGLPIEIFNRFLHDLEATIAKQCKTRSCHNPSLSKEGLEGLYMWGRTRTAVAVARIPYSADL